MSFEQSSLLGSFSGHPLVDYGRAAITAFSKRERPEDVTAEDLRTLAEWLARYYPSPLFSKFSTVLWTTNWPFNPSVKEPGRREQGLKAVQEAVLVPLLTNKQSTAACVFDGRIAAARLARDRIPMLMGRGNFNFYARGSVGGLDVCAGCVSALQGLILAPYVSGRAVLMLADESSFTIALAKEQIASLRSRATLVDAASNPSELKHVRSRALDHIMGASRMLNTACGVTIYAVSNSGQGPALDIYRLRSGIPRFLRVAPMLAEHAWRAFLAFNRYGKAKGDEAPEVHRYDAIEDLFNIEDHADRVVRQTFLPFVKGVVIHGAATSEVRSQIWPFSQLFAREVLMLDSDRLAAIERLGDSLAEVIIKAKDRRLGGLALRAANPHQILDLLNGASRRWNAQIGRPLLPFTDAKLIFAGNPEPTARDWRVAWDFVLIRMLERLGDAAAGLEDQESSGQEEEELNETVYA